MQIKLHEPIIREPVARFPDDGEGSVVGYGGKLGRFYVRGDRNYVRIVLRRRLN